MAGVRVLLQSGSDYAQIDFANGETWKVNSDTGNVDVFGARAEGESGRSLLFTGSRAGVVAVYLIDEETVADQKDANA